MNGIFDETKLLSADEVAEVLGIKKSTLKKWVQEKRIPYVKFSLNGSGKKSIVRFSGKRLNQWLEELSVEPEDGTGHPAKPRKLKQASKKTIDRFNQFTAEM
jgi:excisionase family DNA binding protein